MILQRKRKRRGMKQVKNRSFKRKGDMEENIVEKKWLLVMVS